MEIWKHQRSFVEASLEIRDCNRSITLDFGYRGDEIEEFETAIRKIDTVLSSIETLRAHMLSCYPIAKEAAEQLAAEKAAKKEMQNPHLGSEFKPE